MSHAEFSTDLDSVLRDVRDMLINKNVMYGDSALAPRRIFSKAGNIEQIKVRIDDKLSRLATGSNDEGEDVEQDLIGYLLLLRIARKRQLECGK